MFSSSSPTSLKGNVKGAGELPGLEDSGQALPPIGKRGHWGALACECGSGRYIPTTFLPPLTNVEEG